jgi:two-component system osmolarity sensor histidine kinase EnvZ
MLRSSLFWRSFLLIAGLVIACLALMLQLVHLWDPAPPGQRLAWEIASVVNLTRSGLVSAQSDRRRQLLTELAREESVRVVPLEPGDRIAPLDPAPHARALQAHLKALLGPATRLAGRVNGESGVWVSFDIDDDPYWLGLDPARLERQGGPPWWALLILAGGLGLLGALAVAAPLSRPLADLAAALGRLSRGEATPPLGETGPPEVAALNRRFNRMAAALADLDEDRAVALAGISHDIRTPLTRLRLALELSGLPEDERGAMSDDIERIDEIVGKFIEYARAGGEGRPEQVCDVDIGEAIALALAKNRPIDPADRLTVESRIERGLVWRGDPTDLDRMLGNVIQNALRYGRSPDTGAVELEIHAQQEGDALVITVRDRGPGVPIDARERLMRPFARFDDARGTSAGSGLGLAIVARLAARQGGSCALEAGPQERGLLVRIRLAAARAPGWTRGSTG